jgi:trigger factor
MASAATSERPNTVKISDAGPSRKKISIEIPASVVSEKLKISMDMLVADAALPGFRRGHAPRGLIEKRFGDSVRGEAKQQLVSEAFRAAVEANKLEVVGDPTSETLPAVKIEDGKPLSFEVEVEVMPTFDLPELEGVVVNKPMFEVTGEMVDNEVKMLCVNDGELESREKAEAGDYVTGHAIMKDDKGTEFYNIKGAVVQSPTKDKDGKGMILGIMVDDFAKQMGNPKAGDTFTVKTTGPDNHEVEKIRGAKLTVSFAAERVDRIIPAAASKIVANYGMDSEDALKDAIKQRLEQRVAVQQQVAMRSQIAKHLLDKTKMDLPERLSAVQAARALERQRLELLYRGVEMTKIEERMAELRSSTSKSAAAELKLSFILGKAAQALSVGVYENEVNNRIAQIAFERGMRPERLRQELMKNNQIQGVLSQIVEHKTYDAILQKAKISEMPAAEYNKMTKAAGEQVS